MKYWEPASLLPRSNLDLTVALMLSMSQDMHTDFWMRSRVWIPKWFPLMLLCVIVNIDWLHRSNTQSGRRWNPYTSGRGQGGGQGFDTRSWPHRSLIQTQKIQSRQLCSFLYCTVLLSKYVPVHSFCTVGPALILYGYSILRMWQRLSCHLQYLCAIKHVSQNKRPLSSF